MNDQEFLDFWNTVKWPQEQVIYYRLYYNDSGEPLCYSHKDQPGKYIDVSPEQFALGDMQVRVINGVLKPRAKPLPLKLVPSDQGTSCHPNDVAIVVNQNQQYQKWKRRSCE